MPESRENPPETPANLPLPAAPGNAPDQRTSDAKQMSDRDGRSVSAKLPLATTLRRAFALRCPVCGEGRMFSGWLRMNKRCSHCGLWFERDSGYFLGSIYVNYVFTTVIAALAYFVPMLWIGRPPVLLLVPIVGFCVVFPLFFFRYARAIWLGLDNYMSPLDVAELPPHER